MRNWFATHPTPAADGPLIKGDFPPVGFFRLVLGDKRMLAHNSPAFGLRAPVKNVFTVGGVRFVRGLLVPLPVWKKPARQPSGLVVRGDHAFRDTTTLEGFNGEFTYSPLR
jgi:hypothetical protein